MQKKKSHKEKCWKKGKKNLVLNKINNVSSHYLSIINSNLKELNSVIKRHRVDKDIFKIFQQTCSSLKAKQRLRVE